MNLDRTFCSGVRCLKANTCDRWIPNMAKQAQEEGIDLKDRKLSVANFSDHRGDCEMFIPIKNTQSGPKS